MSTCKRSKAIAIETFSASVNIQERRARSRGEHTATRPSAVFVLEPSLRRKAQAILADQSQFVVDERFAGRKFAKHSMLREGRSRCFARVVDPARWY